jgi:hypothetical protein
MVVTLVPVIEISGARADEGSDSGSFASARDCANRRAPRRADSNTFECFHVTAVAVIIGSRIVPCGAYSCLGRKDSQKYKEGKNSGYQAVFHIHHLPVEGGDAEFTTCQWQWYRQGEEPDLRIRP